MRKVIALFVEFFSALRKFLERFGFKPKKKEEYKEGQGDDIYPLF